MELSDTVRVFLSFRSFGTIFYIRIPYDILPENGHDVKINAIGDITT